MEDGATEAFCTPPADAAAPTDADDAGDAADDTIPWDGALVEDEITDAVVTSTAATVDVNNEMEATGADEDEDGSTVDILLVGGATEEEGATTGSGAFAFAFFFFAFIFFCCC